VVVLRVLQPLTTDLTEPGRRARRSRTGVLLTGGCLNPRPFLIPGLQLRKPEIIAWQQSSPGQWGEPDGLRPPARRVLEVHVG